VSYREVRDKFVLYIEAWFPRASNDEIIGCMVLPQRRFDKQAAKHHWFECLIPGVASMTL
jgi:hypothetical protein